MIVGIDRSFKPEWVYKILRLCVPGEKFTGEIENEAFQIIEYSGKRSKSNVLAVIKRFYLNLERKSDGLWVLDNYLHDLSLKLSFNDIKPILLCVLLNNCEIANFLQSKINTFFINKNQVDVEILKKLAIDAYGDRSNVKKAVNYYLTILSYFNVLDKVKKKYFWKNKKLILLDVTLKEMLIEYSFLRDNFEIDLDNIFGNVEFSLFNLSNLEIVLMKYNSVNWVYQKRPNSKKIIINKKQ